MEEMILAADKMSLAGIILFYLPPTYFHLLAKCFCRGGYISGGG
jgi:hypothetical protein